MRQSRNRCNDSNSFIYVHFFFQIIQTRCQVKSSRLEVDLLPAERHAYAHCARCDTTRLKSIILLMVIVAVAVVSVAKDAEPAQAHTHNRLHQHTIISQSRHHNVIPLLLVSKRFFSRCFCFSATIIIIASLLFHAFAPTSASTSPYM